MSAIWGLLRAALTDPNANAYFLFGLFVFLTVLALLYLISVGCGTPSRPKVRIERNPHRRYFTEER
jgi:uncharacterized protein (DUF58 family)